MALLPAPTPSEKRTTGRERLRVPLEREMHLFLGCGTASRFDFGAVWTRGANRGEEAGVMGVVASRLPARV